MCVWLGDWAADVPLRICAVQQPFAICTLWFGAAACVCALVVHSGACLLALLCPSLCWQSATYLLGQTSACISVLCAMLVPCVQQFWDPVTAAEGVYVLYLHKVWLCLGMDRCESSVCWADRKSVV